MAASGYAAKSLFRPEMSLYGVILFLTEFIRGAALISFLPIFGKNSLGLNLDVIGIAITAHYLTDTVVKLAMGYLLNRWSVKLVVGGGVIATLAGMLLIGYAEWPWLFIAASGLLGIGISPIWIVCLTHVRENRRGTQMGILYTVWLVGLGSGPVVSNLLLEIGYALTFWVMVGVAFASCLLSLLIPGSSHAELNVVPFSRQLAQLGVRLREMKLLIPGMVLQTLAAGMLVPILPSFAEDHLGMSPTHYSILLFAGGAFTAVGLIPMGRLADRFGKQWFLIAGFCVFGIALFALMLGPPLALSFAFAAVLGIAYSAILPAWNALLAAYVPKDQRGLGWGVLSTVEGLGGMIGPSLGGLAAASFGEPFVVGSAGAIFIVICIVYLLFPIRLFRG
ncbi:MFS transporter [Cohnella massiliensis]|uniref:MFS transporter n=1 Tax=Cohnella massiliensis TaxID=1816691 RepID=UPI0009B985DC|nr:MFS transporter [Cohnella massiliensis]